MVQLINQIQVLILQVKIKIKKEEKILKLITEQQNNGDNNKIQVTNQMMKNNL